MCSHRHGPDYDRKLEERRKESRNKLRNFVRIAKAVTRKGGRVAYEWPRHATGWKLPELQQMIKDLDMYIVDCDGCAFGVTS